MAFKTFTSAVLSSSDMNEYLMRQALIVATSGARPASPNEGMAVYETDTDKLLVYTTATTGWQPPWNLPWGQLAYASVSANQGTITSETDLTSLTVTVTVPANRRLRITAQGEMLSTATDDSYLVWLKESTTYLHRAGGPTPVANVPNSWSIQARVDPSAGSHTYKLTAGRTAGSGTLGLVAAATYPAFLLVEDIGPVGAPA